MNERDLTRERFVSAIADKVNPENVAEVHLFHPIKQSGLESGVAVLAIREGQLATVAEGDAENTPDAASDLAAAAENDPGAETDPIAENVAARISVYTAKYRLTLKGPERGKWTFDIHADADAPLVTVDKVVQGVQRRSGDAELAEKLSGDEFRALLPPRDVAQGQAV